MIGAWARRLFRSGNSSSGNQAEEHRTDPPEPEVDEQAPSALSRKRIESYLARRDYRFEIDSAGDLTGIWDGNQLWVVRLGTKSEILQVRGRWHKTLNSANRLSALRAVNDWNRDRLWPKVYLREEDTGLALYAEVSVDLEHGATDAQLEQYLACGIATTTRVLNAVTTMFAEPG